LKFPWYNLPFNTQFSHIAIHYTMPMQERSSIVVEEYLQVIYSLISENQIVKSIHLANRLKTSPSTVHATLSRLQRDKLIIVGKKKEITLTKKGVKVAEDLTRRHRLVETFLCDKLGISWHEVHKHAHILEHGLTDLVEEKLAEFMDFPKSCPHGTPLPGEKDTLPKDLITLDKVPIGKEVKIIIIYESLEESVDLMKFFQDKGIKPGKKHSILEKTDVTKTMLLQSESSAATISYEIASQIGVSVI
jgi:DtxR family transcriptional regulator, Mn-dependent transcriptional regulator